MSTMAMNLLGLLMNVPVTICSYLMLQTFADMAHSILTHRSLRCYGNYYFENLCVFTH